MAAVKGTVAVFVLGFGLAASGTHARPPIFDSVKLNIGINCRWERQCISAQEQAMRRSLAYVRTKRPPATRIHLCNRNASRARYRVDWVGFDNCIRNGGLGIYRGR